MKLMIQKAWHGKKTGLVKMRKLVISQDQERLTSGKLASDPKLGVVSLFSDGCLVFSRSDPISFADMATCD